MEYGIGLYQRLRMPLTSQTLRALSAALSTMGQVPLNPPDVAGYPEGLEWAGTSNLLSRYNGAYTVAYTLSSTQVSQLLASIDVSRAETLLDGLLYQLGPIELGDASHAALLAYLQSGGYSGRNTARVHTKARGALHLIAATPEYQLN
ncbi:MAG: DUF1800 family protein [Hydrogenophilales bacterium]|nr:DUF1800 family protein [Hydrogenophilales bacterium]